MMNITIKTLTGKNINIDVQSSDSVISIKEKIKDMVNINVPYQNLLFNGKQLENDKYLNDYDIQNGSILYVLVMLR